MNKNKNSIHNQKHLTLTERIYIEQELVQGSTFSSIASIIDKDPSTISKEVNRARIIEDAGYTGKCHACQNYGDCFRKSICGDCLRRMLTSLGFKITNNHAFRMSLNSNILAGKLNLTDADRAKLLGHSAETNIKYYTYASKDNMDDLVNLFNAATEVSPRSHLEVVNFTKEKSPESAKFKAL